MLVADADVSMGDNSSKDSEDSEEDLQSNQSNVDMDNETGNNQETRPGSAVVPPRRWGDREAEEGGTRI